MSNPIRTAICAMPSNQVIGDPLGRGRFFLDAA
jgi:hypothetical protein